MADPSPEGGTLPRMSKDKSATSAQTSPAPSPSADAPRPAPAAGPGRIQPAPEPAFADPLLVDADEQETLSVVVAHGSLRRDGERYDKGDTLSLPAAEAKRLEAQGIVLIRRRPA